MKYGCTTNYPAFNISAPMDSMDSLENVPPAARLIRPASEGTSWYRTSPDGWDRMASITRYHKGIMGHHKAKAAISQNGVFVSRHPKMEFFDVFCPTSHPKWRSIRYILPYSAIFCQLSQLMIDGATSRHSEPAGHPSSWAGSTLPWCTCSA